MKHYRQRRRRQILNINNKKNSALSIRDIAVPIIAALVAVILNQWFYESNKRTDAWINYEIESIKLQRPVLNRILSFTYKNELIVLTTVLRHTYIYVDTVSESGDNKNPRDGETVTIDENYTDSLPAFIVYEDRRNRLMQDLAYIKENRDLLDHEIYIIVDELLDYIEEYPMPDLHDDDEMSKTKWRESKVRNGWQDIIDKLRNSCWIKLNSFN